MGLRPAGWLQGAPRVHGELASVDFLAGRVIGSLRRECLDHVIVLDERHVKLILHGYVGYYRGCRTQLSLDEETPEPRLVESPRMRRLMAVPKAEGFTTRAARRAVVHRT